jgi:hypothetical protein
VQTGKRRRPGALSHNSTTFVTVSSSQYTSVFQVESMEFCQLTVQGDGTTKYGYSSSTSEQLPTIGMFITKEKGVCTVALSESATTQPLYYEEPVALSVTGANQVRVCKQCLRKISAKAKARNDCPRLTYCSEECLASATDYLDYCGPFLSEIHQLQSPEWAGILHMLLLAISYVHAVQMASTAAMLTKALSILHLESHTDTSCTELLEPALWLSRLMCSKLPAAQLDSLARRGIDLRPSVSSGANPQAHNIMYKVLRIIKYNAQPLTVYGVPKVQLLALLPSVARINHSCRPNCTLLYDVAVTMPATADEAVECTARVSVLPLRLIAAGEELTVSYLQVLCAPGLMRRSLLQQGFAFTCRCERCEAAEGTQLARNTAGTPLERELQRATQAVSRGQLLLPEEVRSLMQYAEQALRGSSTEDIIVSAAHDAASLVLEQAKNRIKQSQSQGSSGNDNKYALQILMVRAQLALALCWRAAGCGNCMQRIEFAVTAAQMLIEAQQRMSAGPAVDEQLAVRVRQELQAVVEVMRTVYATSYCGEQGNTPSHTGALSSAQYVRRLYDTALRCMDALR